MDLRALSRRQDTKRHERPIVESRAADAARDLFLWSSLGATDRRDQAIVAE